MKGSTMSNPLVLTVLDGTPLVDTRIIATGFGVDHRSTTRLVDNYSAKFQEFGQLRFEITVGHRPQGGGNPEKFYLLNEDQTYFLLTLTRNTAQVVDLKQRLVMAFAEFRKAQAKPAPKPRQLTRKHYQLLQSEVDEVAKWTAQPGRAKAAVWEHLRKVGGVDNVRYFPPAKMTEALSVLVNLKKRTRAFVNDSKASERVFIDTILTGSQLLPASKQPAFKLLEAA